MTGTIKQIKTAFMLLVILTLLTGVLYPLLVTGLAQLLFPWQANGSILNQNGKEVASLLIGQSFTGDDYFWGRPSATTPYYYNASNSSASNLGPSNPDFLATVKSRVGALRQSNPGNQGAVPVDLVTASGSGLDPEISPLAAYYQVGRVAKARGIAEDEVKKLVDQVIRQRVFGFLGEARVNIVQLNLALDNLADMRNYSGGKTR